LLLTLLNYNNCFRYSGRSSCFHCYRHCICSRQKTVSISRCVFLNHCYQQKACSKLCIMKIFKSFYALLLITYKRSSFVRNVCSVLSVLSPDLFSFTVMWEFCLNKSLTYMHTPLSPTLTPILFTPHQIGGGGNYS